ncbi:MAG: PAS domain-containing sensor histidine kinase [Chloroflexi bacterium]|nr:PAS domain-containing sensor histidine kinase [Chloroflexota bacterium]
METASTPSDAPHNPVAGEIARTSDEKLAAVFRLSPDMILVSTQADGRCLDVNAAFLHHTGYTRDEIIGHTTRELSWWNNPDDHRKLLEQLARDGAVRGLEVEYRRKSGEIGYAVLTAGRIVIDGEPCLIAMAQDVTDYKQAQADLHSRNDELDAFARTVAHDLKSPLGNIVGFGEYLQARPDLPEATRQDFINTIVRNAFKMQSVIDELRLLAKLRTGDAPLQPLDMSRLIGEAQHQLTFMIAESSAVIAAPDHWPAALGYGPWVKEVWINYLSHAIKYGGQPPHIELGSDVQPNNTICFWVKHDGPGLPPELEARFFQPFTQLSTVRAPGHGLGLSIVRQIVEKMGGQVGVDTAPGGCRFWFTLPVAD